MGHHGGGGHHHHHHHHGMGRPLMGPRVGYVVGGGRGGRRGGCVVGVILGAIILVGAIIALVVVFGVDAQCPSNKHPCKECASWMNTTIDKNGTNATHWHIEEICWERLQWGNLTQQQQLLWGELGQTQQTWDKDIHSARAATNLCWNELATTELSAAEALGYRRETWNWGGGCGVDTFYYSVYYYYYYDTYYYYYYGSYYTSYYYYY